MSITIKNLTLLGKDDFAKVVGDVLRSLKVTVAAANEAAEFDDLEIFNEIIGRRIITRLKVSLNGAQIFLRKSSLARQDERFGAEVNRLVKKNLYTLLVNGFGLEEVPYGILHGVRPTKIIQRWIDGGFGVTSQGVIDRDKIYRRIVSDFLTDRDKANLLTEVSVRQLPIIRTSDDKTVSVYVGIPFCKTRCLYCSFPSFVLPGEEQVADFMATLTRDITAAANAIKRYGLKVQTVYVGGGTPTALPEKFFAEMIEKVHDNFNCAGVEEFTVECGRPDTITAEKISVMKNFGVTRVSVNPQTMHQRTLDLIGRKHTVEDVTRAFNELRTAGDWLINMDLIIGLPGECLVDFKETLEKILALKPDDVTIHSLAIKRGSNLQKNLADEINRLEDFNLPDDKEVRRMAEHAERILRGKKFLPYYLYRQGYMSGQIENVGWCQSGAAGIYNVQIMGERQTILGVGAAASTKVPDPVAKKILTAFNAKDLPTYLHDIDRYIEQREKILAQVYSPAAATDELSTVESIAATEPSIVESVVATDESSIVESVVATDEPSIVESVVASEPSIVESVVVTDEPSIVESVVASEPSIVESIAATESSIVESVAATDESSIAESIVASESSIIEPVAATESSIAESVVATESSIAESVAASESLIVESVVASEPSIIESVVATESSIVESVAATDEPSIVEPVVEPPAKPKRSRPKRKKNLANAEGRVD